MYAQAYPDPAFNLLTADPNQDLHGAAVSFLQKIYLGTN
jgi:hypothetical protein